MIRSFSIVAKLQRCREEREIIIREKALEKPSSAKSVNSSKSYCLKQESFDFIFLEPSHVNDRTASRL
jgi:hypothetical protein